MRLTERTEDGEVCIINKTDPEGAYNAEDYARWMGNDTGELAAALDRLAAFEDTGLEPEEVAALKASDKRLRAVLVGILGEAAAEMEMKG